MSKNEVLTLNEAKTLFQEFGNKINNRLDGIDSRLDRVDSRLDKVDSRLDGIDSLLEKQARELKRCSQLIGDISNKMGYVVESAIAPGIVEKFNERGFHFDSVSANVEFLNKKGKSSTEIDILLENGEFVIALETKTDLGTKDVEHHEKRLEILRENSRFNGKRIYGAFATALSKKEQVEYALKKGFYVLQQPDAMKVNIIDFPKGFKAKEW